MRVMKVHLVDGTFELFRFHFGSPPRRGADGRSVGALRGMLMSFIGLLEQSDVSHVGVAFDHVVESFRNDLFDGYKTGEGLAEELEEQFWPAEDLCRALGLTVWPMVEFEADDGLSSAAARFANEPAVEQVVICTPDKDLCQCVQGDRVVQLDRMRRTLRDEAGVWDKFGVAPTSIPDWLALVGDTADGIPGIPRWGAKGAATVLAHYGTVEAIPDDPAEWQVKVRGAASLAANLAERREDALLYKTLATLRLDAPIEEELEDLRWRGADRSAMEAVCAQLRDDRPLERIARWRS